MIGTIARKEFWSVLRDRRVQVAAVCLLLLGAVALASAAARYVSLSGERAAAAALIAEQWRDQGEKNPHSAAHYGIYVFRPVAPLAFFDPGVLPYEGVAIWLEAHRRNLPFGRPAEDMTPLVRFGELSVAFVLQALVPLGLLLLAHASISGERESGTLRQVLATGVPAGALLAGKFFGLGAAALALVAPLLLLGTAALVLAGGMAVLPGTGLLLGVHGVYWSIVLLLALVVSAWARSSQGALVILLAFWAVSTFALPRLAADLGRSLAPTPTLREFRAGIEEDLANGLDGRSPAQRIAERREALFRIYRVQREEDLPVNFQGVVFAVQDELSHEVHDRHFARIESAVDRQLGVHQALAVLSPRLALGLLSQEISGTSLGHGRHFERDAEGFRRGMMDVLNRDIMRNAKAGQGDYRAGPALWRRVGDYRHRPEPLGASLRRTGAPTTVLVLWLAGVLVAVALTARRLRVIA